MYWLTFESVNGPLARVLEQSWTAIFKEGLEGVLLLVWVGTGAGGVQVR